MTLSQRWADLQAERPGLRIADAAAALDVPELALLDTLDTTTRLRADPQALLRGLAGVGPVMALTRNPACVHERTGAYGEPTFHGRIGLVVGEDIDLRIFLQSWVHFRAAVVANARGPLPCFQVFDAAGRAVHKVYAKSATDMVAWEALVASLAEGADTEPVTFTAPPTPPAGRPDADVNAEALQAAWAALRDTHDFFPMLRAQDVLREQALRLVGPSWARLVDGDPVTNVLTAASASEVPIMVFVGNAGIIQIHTGPVRHVAPRGTWINVLDPAFNLHLDRALVARSWWVRKPTTDGDVHALELYDASGELIAQLFGARKPGKPEDARWTAMLADATAVA